MALPLLLWNPIFEWSSAALGDLSTFHLGAAFLVEATGPDVEKKSTDEFVLWLIACTTCRSSERPKQGEVRGPYNRLTQEEIARLAPDEVAAFVENFVKHMEREDPPAEAESAPTPDPSATVPPSERLRRLVRAQGIDLNKRMSDFAEKLRKSMPDMSKVFSPATLQAMQQSTLASQRLADMAAKIGSIQSPGLKRALDQINQAAASARGLGAMPQVPRVPLEHFTPPPNPAHKTNEHLRELVDVAAEVKPLVVEASGAIASMHDVVVNILADFKRASDAAQKQARIAIGIAVASIVVASAVQLWISYNDGSEAVVAAMTLDRAEHVEARRSLDEHTKAILELAAKVEAQATATRELAASNKRMQTPRKTAPKPAGAPAPAKPITPP